MTFENKKSASVFSLVKLIYMLFPPPIIRGEDGLVFFWIFGFFFWKKKRERVMPALVKHCALARISCEIGLIYQVSVDFSKAKMHC